MRGMNVQDQLPVFKEQLQATDDEWRTLSPKLEKVLNARQAMNTGAGMNWRSSNNAKPTFEPSSTKPDTEPGRAMQDVRDAVAREDASKDELAAKIAALRKARQAARAKYEAAQKELTDALTPRQQAILMTLGLIE
jgi:hypothetical protein